MTLSRQTKITLPTLALIAATRGAIGFGAGLLLADKFNREHRRTKDRKAASQLRHLGRF